MLIVGHARMLAEQAAARQPEAQLTAAYAVVVGDHRDRYPELAAAVAESTTDTQDQAFEFGLARILDGLDMLVRRRAERA